MYLSYFSWICMHLYLRSWSSSTALRLKCSEGIFSTDTVKTKRRILVYWKSLAYPASFCNHMGGRLTLENRMYEANLHMKRTSILILLQPTVVKRRLITEIMQNFMFRIFAVRSDSEKTCWGCCKMNVPSSAA